MARAVIKTEFPSAEEAANVLGVSRTHTMRLVDLAKRSLSASRNGRRKARPHVKKAASSRIRRSSR